ncbi:hypothetical protein PD5205_00279 [Xanthomonas fragariae]|uniref:Uncharacterized protein n=1 Tax=Xanthomonas fragariae TaxID=48664 RepID=A0A1Y6HDI5_9XANT|nr:hypothetical protein NBC2815_00197 [Xanthomonas fragariae]SMR00949.1 hypothetical protein PD885_03728 [Xanthomonas fragariae]SMR01599.1 hypothetical protein PD5205_00279 [Xanthomonas fragariae]
MSQTQKFKIHSLAGKFSTSELTKGRLSGSVCIHWRRNAWSAVTDGPRALAEPP